MTILLISLANTADRSIKAAMASYKAGSSAGDLAGVILKEISAWNPTYRGQPVLTNGLRVKLASALGELAFNLAAIDARSKK